MGDSGFSRWSVGGNVFTLSKTEIETLRTLPKGVKVPRVIQRKAADHARERIAAGLDPFYQDGE